MTGQDFQDVLDNIVRDLQTTAKGMTAEIAFRNSDNSTTILPLSSDSLGIINNAQLSAVEAVINSLKPVANTYETERQPVADAIEAFNVAKEPHEALAMAATNARKALSDAYEADANYQTKKTALEMAREDVNYVDALTNYRSFNVSENYGNLGDARGKYRYA